MRAIRNEAYLDMGRQTQAQKEVQAAWEKLRKQEARRNSVFCGVCMGIMLAAVAFFLHAAWNGAEILLKWVSM